MPVGVAIINGPNLNLLGEREPHIYGSTTLAMIEAECTTLAGELGVSLSFRQSNHEGVLVDWIQQARGTAHGIIINPAGYSFISVALPDALRAFEGPVIELHISNIHAREETYRHSRLSAVATAVICGLGSHGYSIALRSMAQMLNVRPGV